MLLSGQTIKKYVIDNQLIENGNLDCIHSSSYDVTISNKILRLAKNKKISLIDANAIESMYKEVSIDKGYYIKPGETILVVLKEKFNMPLNMTGMIRGRTSFNRLGLYVATQHINPGYCGVLNIAITNNSSNSYMLMPNMNIAQVVFEELDIKVDEKSVDVTKYQNEDGKSGSKIYQDYIGKVVRHFKGNYYFIENVALDSETQEYVVFYRALYPRDDSQTWVRNASMFFEKIDSSRKDNITKQTYRFEIADDVRKDYTK